MGLESFVNNIPGREEKEMSSLENARRIMDAARTYEDIRPRKNALPINDKRIKQVMAVVVMVMGGGRGGGGGGCYHCRCTAQLRRTESWHPPSSFTVDSLLVHMVTGVVLLIAAHMNQGGMGRAFFSVQPSSIPFPLTIHSNTQKHTNMVIHETHVSQSRPSPGAQRYLSLG